MDWQLLELLKILVLIILAIALHQLIRRFGKNYAADIFRSTPQTGTSFLALADIAYFLIFAAYILFSVRFERPESWADTVNATQIQESVASIAGICLIIGILHGMNVFALPFVGSLLALRAKFMEPRRE